MNKPKTLILTGGHPDDETFGVGGTLAHYAAAGYRVYYVCGTRGEAGEVSPEFMKGYKTIADLRTHELKCAAKVLGLADVIYLGYRDSGMAGTPDNQHPNALAAAPTEQVAGRIVKILRELKPEVIMTSDPTGGYGHPDHIAIHKATVMAFCAAADPQKYPEAGPAFQPQKLYYHVFRHRFLKYMVKVMQFFGRDVHHMGRNKDIDFAAFVENEFPVHCVVRLKKKSVQTRNQAAACHASQIGGGVRRRGLFGVINRIFGQRDCYTRVYPPVQGHVHEGDLFQGVK
jgi:N-acetyl-1-D-myo-inositol-2-amino-2-deoxy-alpha-D-glucopyranoside deacetylase/mycothiol S-conjugate amidase